MSGSKGRKDSRIFNRRSYCGPAATLPSSSTTSTAATEKKVKHKKERPSSVMMFTQSWLGEDSTPHSASASQRPKLTVLTSEDQVQTSPPDVSMSLCSSEVTSNVGSALSSPTGLQTSSLGIHLDTVESSFKSSPDVDKDYRPKRSKSMVENVKSFFTSPYKKLSRHPSMGAELLTDSLPPGVGRTRSSPNSYLHDPSRPTLPSVTVHPVDIDADTPTPDRSLPDRGRDPADALGRKRSLFAYGRRHATDISRLSAVSAVSATSSTTETSGSSSPVRRRSVKDILLHFRNS